VNLCDGGIIGVVDGSTIARGVASCFVWGDTDKTVSLPQCGQATPLPERNSSVANSMFLPQWSQGHLAIIILLPRARAAANKKGVTYSRSATGTGMPSWNAFRHARWGVSSALSMISKLPVLLRTAAEATQIGLLCFFWSLFLADGDNSNTNCGRVQARDGNFMDSFLECLI
jgi:hypothetical protein